ncbi:MAG: DNA methylase [Ignavibacteria bacterium RIFOXYB2_FULL_35_12]|nr:MAG: DNA methylase [Ignavibacteria bacterium GWA2_36_19]OGU52618.1 MAG: DNA methylase [Ignavibacteria bacterium GWC2_35_8]OGU59285.1 MAG: DNA methylase [Ignavibacteria bacterium GWF2_35_20]OGU78373.1 MAG: DNA methylase [Ignavibacteria bacterium RIFOXYA2_FULL_35_9]OGU86522.1 MAG: DNA methylase [Ignavibacteria bacterium RIFOXYA12_FULL_35_25]OGU86882.1 MAG: DNA methylase [Ignavibacteria bacterium RIFOXYC12_FULL_35_11]OGU97771.1 MAG: DNA methylase [Ignavibacteria bacterium RIFOXYB12_FULL_35_14
MKRPIIPYNPALKEKARQLKNNSTYPEIMLWNYLKCKQMKGYDFHRQKPIDNYIVDFFCNELMLAIEVDGESHYRNEKRDERRQKKIESYGIEFLRFDDLDIVHKLDLVIKRIEKWIDEYETRKNKM